MQGTFQSSLDTCAQGPGAQGSCKVQPTPVSFKVHMTATTTLCLVRHGETDWNLRGLTQGSTDIPLNETGRRQAGATGLTLSANNWDRIITSTLSRAQETGRIIAEKTGVTSVEVVPGLEERSYGEAEGLSMSERGRRFPDSVVPGAERWEAVRRRSLGAIDSIAKRYRGERIIAVSHGGTIINLLSAITGEELKGTVVLENACMNLLTHEGSWKVMWMNRVADPALQLTG